jgi:hypothetical protein
LGKTSGEKKVYFAAEKQQQIELIATRVARWCILKPKIAIWVNFGGSCNGRCWHILLTYGLFYSHLIYFGYIWYILWYFPRCDKKSGSPVGKAG